MRKSIISLLSLLAAISAGTILAQVEFTPERKLRYAEQIIEHYYVDQIDTTKMVTEAITAMLKTLDPHSTYSNPQETKELTEPLEGNFSGIGIRFQMLKDTLFVVESIVGGPSERLGIIPGDRIISCNDTIIAGRKLKNSDILKTLRGPRGTVANLKVLRRGATSPLDFKVIREEIPIYSVDAAYMANDSVGYISISRFAESTTREVVEAMQRLEAAGMRHLILDLADNGGGYLLTATEIANIFLRKGDLLVYTDSPKNGQMNYNAPTDGPFRNGRLVVTVNQFSASASEILSGAIQDHDRGVIVGRRTFGKGLVQRPFNLPDGSMIRLTVSRYHTPSGRCIQKPYTPGDEDQYRADILNRYKAGEFTSADSIHLPDSLLFTTLRLHRPVYGGGGIMPDIFVPIDTTYYSDYYRDLTARGVLLSYTTSYVDTHRDDILRQYPTEDSFVANFQVTPEMLDTLRAEGEKEGVKFSQQGFDTSRTYIALIIKAIIGRDLYEQSTYYRIVNPLNPIFAQALKTITDPAAYASHLSAPSKTENAKIRAITRAKEATAKAKAKQAKAKTKAQTPKRK